MLEIVFQDEFLTAINKPHGLLVHRSKIALNAEEFALQLLRDQLDKHVYPCHRLDRKTSGILLFAHSPDMQKSMNDLFMEKKIAKKYLAIVRGYADDKGSIDYQLTNLKGKIQDALTHYECLERTEIDVPFGKFNTSRYSLLEIQPETGRTHQIRKHLAHIFHPIIGDRPHGCNKQNKLFLETWNMNTMLLHASELHFLHPISNEKIQIQARHHDEFQRSMDFLNFNNFALESENYLT